MWRRGCCWASTMVTVGEAVDWDEGEVFEFCPHGDRASLGVVFCEPLATEPVTIGNVGVVRGGDVTVGGADEG